jgi:hypothetical protein
MRFPVVGLVGKALANVLGEFDVTAALRDPARKRREALPASTAEQIAGQF